MKILEGWVPRKKSKPNNFYVEIETIKSSDFLDKVRGIFKCHNLRKFMGL